MMICATNKPSVGERTAIRLQKHLPIIEMALENPGEVSVLPLQPGFSKAIFFGESYGKSVVSILLK